jgi:hypothetical protein
VRRADYLRQALRLYLDQPDTPAAPSRSDWAIADDLYQQGIELDTLAHAIRIATLRRCRRPPEAPPLKPVRSLAYYRQVLAGLDPEELEPGYVGYIERLFQQLRGERLGSVGEAELKDTKARADRQNPAVCGRR